MRVARASLAACVLVGLAAGRSAAQSIPAETDLPTGPRAPSLHLWNGFALGTNPLVFGDLLKAYLKMPWGNGETLLTSDSHWRIGTHLTASPTYLRPAILIGVSPLLILDLDVHYGPGINTYHYTYGSYWDAYDPTSLGPRPPGIGVFHQATANLTLKAAVGPLALLSLLDVDRFWSDQFFFDWECGIIMKDGWDTRSKTFLAWELVKEQRLFVNYEWYRYHSSGFRSQLISAGAILTSKSFFGMTLIGQVGYHLKNEKFKGVKLWMALLREWDFR
jgi:hypothetical protein